MHPVFPVQRNHPTECEDARYKDQYGSQTTRLEYGFAQLV
jgi:hypothetical protein